MTLREWFQAAKASGIVYYVREDKSRTNMSGTYSLYTVHENRLERAWPDSGEGFDDKLAKELGFRLSKRAWHRNGVGYNRVRAIVESIGFHATGERGDVLRGISFESLHSEG